MFLPLGASACLLVGSIEACFAISGDGGSIFGEGGEGGKGGLGDVT